MARRRRRQDSYDDEYYDDRNDDREYDHGYDDEYDHDNYGSGQPDYDDDGPDYEIDEEYAEIIEDDDYGINLQSKKKAGRYRIIGALFLLLVIGIGAFVFFYKQQVAKNNMTSCWQYQYTVENRVKSYVETNGLSASPAYVEDVPGIAGVKFTCPDGGGFTWNPVDGTYVCSVHGHYPESFVTPESTVTGTEVQEVTDEQ